MQQVKVASGHTCTAHEFVRLICPPCSAEPLFSYNVSDMDIVTTINEPVIIAMAVLIPLLFASECCANMCTEVSQRMECVHVHVPVHVHQGAQRVLRIVSGSHARPYCGDEEGLGSLALVPPSFLLRRAATTCSASPSRC